MQRRSASAAFLGEGKRMGGGPEWAEPAVGGTMDNGFLACDFPQVSPPRPPPAGIPSQALSRGSTMECDAEQRGRQKAVGS